MALMSPKKIQKSITRTSINISKFAFCEESLMIQYSSKEKHYPKPTTQKDIYNLISKPQKPLYSPLTSSSSSNLTSQSTTNRLTPPVDSTETSDSVHTQPENLQEGMACQSFRTRRTDQTDHAHLRLRYNNTPKPRVCQ